jgi:predicted transcriptional regulator
MQVGEVMTRNPEAVRSSDNVKKAAEVMKRINVGVVPVFDGGDTIGLLTDRDITIRVVAEGKDPMNTKAGDVMSREVITCSEETDVREAFRTMQDKKIRRLLVTDNRSKIVGVVSFGDLAVATDKEMAGEAISEISKPAEPSR